MIGGKQSGEERTEEEGRGREVTVLTCAAQVRRWKCCFIGAEVDFCKDAYRKQDTRMLLCLLWQYVHFIFLVGGT